MPTSKDEDRDKVQIELEDLNELQVRIADAAAEATTAENVNPPDTKK